MENVTARVAAIDIAQAAILRSLKSSNGCQRQRLVEIPVDLHGTTDLIRFLWIIIAFIESDQVSVKVRIQ